MAAAVLVAMKLANLRVRHCVPEDPRLRPFLTVTRVLLALAWIGLVLVLALICYLS